MFTDDFSRLLMLLKRNPGMNAAEAASLCLPYIHEDGRVVLDDEDDDDVPFAIIRFPKDEPEH